MRLGPRRWVLAAVAVTAGWLSATGGVPLYDGVGFPDQPYRFVRAPAGVKHGPPPQPATVVSPVLHGMSSGELLLQTAELGPQVLVDLPPGAAGAPAGATSVTAVVTPLPPDAGPPDGQIDGNIYRFSVMSDVGPASFASTVGDSFLYLRAASLLPAPPVMEWRPRADASWRKLTSGRGGADVIVSGFRGAGDYALVHLSGARPIRSRGGPNLLLVLGGGFVVLVLAAAVLARQPWRARPGDDGAR